MRFYEAAMRAVSGDETARRWLQENAHRNDRRIIIACDFDGTLCHSDYPVILEANQPLIQAVKMMQAMGYEFILWTCREEEVLDAAIEWLQTQGVEGMIANDNAQSIKDLYDGYNSRKPFADEYWDDKAQCAAW